MIRNVDPVADAPHIARIYNDYIVGTDISFETRTLSDDEMRLRIEDIARTYPYIVYEEAARIVGYCYAHAWKERAAYSYTLETTVYLAPDSLRRGIGRALMEHLIAACRKAGYHALVACITEGNEASCRLHEKLGFVQVSHFPQVGYKHGRRLGVVDYELLL